MPHDAELILDTQSSLGEGPIWDSSRQLLIWLDVFANELHLFDPRSGNDRVITLDQMPTAVVPRSSGGLIFALEHGFGQFDLDTGKIESWSDPESDIPGNRFNDGKCDPAGRFWAGTMPYDGSVPTGALYCLDTDRSVTKKVTGIRVSNGIAWSADSKTMYYVDSMSHGVDAFDYDLDTTHIDNRRRVIEIPHDEGIPDGITIDTDGNLWIAQWGGKCVSHYDPNTGRLIDKVVLPATNVTACWFGGPSLEHLYITTARYAVSEEELAGQPHAGGLFCTKPGAKGLPSIEYAG